MACEVFHSKRRNEDQIIIGKLGRRDIVLCRTSAKQHPMEEGYATAFGLFSAMRCYPTNSQGGLTLSASEVVALRDMLDRAIKSGEVCEYLTEDQHNSAVKQHKAEQWEYEHRQYKVPAM